MADPIQDPTTREWREHCAKRELVAQHCGSCGSWQHYPRPFCLSCDGDQLTFDAISGRGVVYSITRVHVPMHAQLDPPYLCALVDLDEGLRVLTNVVDDASIGDDVSLFWLDTEDLPLPVFRRGEG